MNELAKILIILGATLMLIGIAMFFFSKIPIPHLPGDIVFRKKNLVIYFPIVSSIILSILLTIILNIFFRR